MNSRIEHYMVDNVEAHHVALFVVFGDADRDGKQNIAAADVLVEE